MWASPIRYKCGGLYFFSQSLYARTSCRGLGLHGMGLMDNDAGKNLFRICETLNLWGRRCSCEHSEHSEHSKIEPLHPAFSAVLQMNTLVLRTTDQRLILSVLLFWTTTANTGFCSTGLFFWRSLQVSWVLGRCPRKESLGLLVRNFLQAGCPLRHPTNCFSALDLSSFQQELIIFIN